MANDPSASDPLADQVLYIQLLQEKNRLLRRNRSSKVDESTREREGGFNTYFNGGNQILAKRLEERRFLEKNRAVAASTLHHFLISIFTLIPSNICFCPSFTACTHSLISSISIPHARTLCAQALLRQGLVGNGANHKLTLAAAVIL